MSDLSGTRGFTGGPGGNEFLATFQDLVTATNAMALAIQASFGQAASGDVSGVYPGPMVVNRLLSTPLAVGVWTPVLEFGGSSPGITYAVQSGVVMRLAKMVVAFFSIALTSKGAQPGNAMIAGLPVACGAMAGIGVIGSCANLATANVFEISVPAAGTKIRLGIGNLVTTGDLADTDFGNATALSGAVFYITA